MRLAPGGVCLAALALGLLATLAGAQDLEAIRQKGALRVLALPTPSSPFFTEQAGNPTGFDHELLTGFCRAHGLRLEVLKPQATDQLVPWLLEGRADVVAGGFTETPARRQVVAFSVPVLPQRHVVLTRRPARRLADLEELRALKRIGTVKGTSWEEALHAAGVPAARIDTSFALTAEALADGLRKGQIEAAVVGAVFASMMVRVDAQVEVGLSLGEAGHNAYAVRKESAELLRALDAHLNAVKLTPNFYRLVVRHFGSAAPEILGMRRPED